MSSSLLWLIGAVVCLLAANRESNCSPTRAMDGRIVRCGIISSCQSAATSEIVKGFWSLTSLTRVRSTIAITGPFPFLPRVKVLPRFRNVALRSVTESIGSRRG